jgi:hypothetical protein
MRRDEICVNANNYAGVPMNIPKNWPNQAVRVRTIATTAIKKRSLEARLAASKSLAGASVWRFTKKYFAYC